MMNTVIQKKDDFIMLPTSDFCFKELMQNSKVRKGIISALLGINPEEIAETAVFLAKSKYITGQVIRVDGGMVIG